MKVKRSRSPDLAIKNTRQLKGRTFTKIYPFCCTGLTRLRLGKILFANRCHGFWLQSVTFVRALNLYGLFAPLISHTASALHIISPPLAAIKKVCLSQNVAYTFPLPCGGSATCWRLPSLNTELMPCFADTRPALI